MSRPNDPQFWLQFFIGAGIPRSTAMQYAITFSENRMDSNMLGDLTKDYLKEMNITLIGDVIAILKHAGEVAKADYFTRKTPNNLSGERGENAKQRNGPHPPPQISSVVNRALPASNGAMDRSVAPIRSSVPSNPNAGKHVSNQNATPNVKLPADAGVYTIHIPASARRKLAEAEAERRRLAAGNVSNRLVRAPSAPQPSDTYASSVPKLDKSVQNLRVVRTPDGHRMVSGRAQQPQPQPQSQSQSNSKLRLIRGAYMDDPRESAYLNSKPKPAARLGEGLNTNRLGKRRSPGMNGSYMQSQAVGSGVSFNVIFGSNANAASKSKRRKLSNGDTSMDLQSSRSARDRLGARTVNYGNGEGFGSRIASAPAYSFANVRGSQTQQLPSQKGVSRANEPRTRVVNISHLQRSPVTDLRGRLRRRRT